LDGPDVVALLQQMRGKTVPKGMATDAFVKPHHSCRNRSCPKCHGQDTEVWLEERRQELLPVPYFHVVFTVPHELGEIIRQHQQDLYDILIRAAAQALIKLAMDPHDVGGLIGVLCVLHTLTRILVYHPHVHCLVPAGGVSADRTQWWPARSSYLVPVHALSKLFRGLFRDLVRQERPDLTIPEAVWTKGWVVYCKPTVQGTEQVLTSMGRYVHRLALTNQRLLSLVSARWPGPAGVGPPAPPPLEGTAMTDRAAALPPHAGPLAATGLGTGGPFPSVCLAVGNRHRAIASRSPYWPRVRPSVRVVPPLPPAEERRRSPQDPAKVLPKWTRLP
jgi:hypothetical protein